MRISPDKIYYGPGGRAQQPPLAALEAAWAKLDPERCRRHIERQWQAADIPLALQGTSWDTLDASRHPAAFAACREYATTGFYQGRRGLLLGGSAGTGKSSLAVATMRATLERIRGQRGVHFWQPAEGLSQIRRSMHGEDGETEDVLDLGCNYLLVVDDLGKQKMTDWAAEQLYRLFDFLWHEERKVIVTTNLSAAEIAASMDPALVSRIMGSCAPVPVTGKDRRLER